MRTHSSNTGNNNNNYQKYGFTSSSYTSINMMSDHAGSNSSASSASSLQAGGGATGSLELDAAPQDNDPADETRRSPAATTENDSTRRVPNDDGTPVTAGDDQEPLQQQEEREAADQQPAVVDSLNIKHKRHFKRQINRFENDYDGEIEKIGDKATALIANGSILSCGLYQFLSFLLVSIAWTVGTGWYSYVSIFSGYTPTHTCNTSASTFPPNATEDDRMCYYADGNKCTSWTYDESQMRSTMITEYNLVCDRNYVFEVAYSIEQVGYIVGTMVFSFVADKVGRKPVLITVLVAMCVFGYVQYFVKDLTLYVVLGFVLNSLACGLDGVCVPLILEMFKTSKRTSFGMGMEIIWVLVLACMSPLAYVVKQWREIRLVIFIVLTVVAVLSYWLVQESVIWLISMCKLKKTRVVIERIARFNHLDTRNVAAKYKRDQKHLYRLFEELELYNSTHTELSKKKEEKAEEEEAFYYVRSKSVDEEAPPPDEKLPLSSEDPLPPNKPRSDDQIMDIFRNKKFRLYVVIMALNWFATALVYDGLTYMNNHLGDNIFLSWILMNLIELPAQFVCYYVMSKHGRRMTTCVTLITAGALLLLTCAEQLLPYVSHLRLVALYVAPHVGNIKLTLYVLAKFAVTQSYSAVILHAPELFPTNLRSFGYGICLFSGKLTSVISPIISFYLVKVRPVLPAVIYGTISIVCGCASLYVPETLNRPLPNSINDVVQWSRTLSKKEWDEVNKVNSETFNLKLVKRLFRKCTSSSGSTKRRRSSKQQRTGSKKSTTAAAPAPPPIPISQSEPKELESIVVAAAATDIIRLSKSSGDLDQKQQQLEEEEATPMMTKADSVSNLAAAAKKKSITLSASSSSSSSSTPTSCSSTSASLVSKVSPPTAPTNPLFATATTTHYIASVHKASEY